METELIPDAMQQAPVPQVPNVPEEVGKSKVGFVLGEIEGSILGAIVGTVDGNADGRADG